MDDILARMLAVEQRAEDLVEKAEAEAERIREGGRRQTLAEKDRLQTELEEKARQLVDEAERKALAKKENALKKADAQLQRRLENFERTIRANAGRVAEVLAFPESAAARDGTSE